MKRSIILFALLFTAVVCSATPISMVFVGFHAPQWQTGYPYFAIVNGGSPLAVMCDDYVHGGFPGQAWEANFTNLGSQNFSQVRFNQLATPWLPYNEAGWLLLQTQVTPPSQWPDINFAVWFIFDHNVILTPAQQHWVDLARQESGEGFPGVDFHQVGVYTPVNQYDPNPNGPQEFLALLSVPEPGTMVLLAGGFLGLLTRKKLR